MLTTQVIAENSNTRETTPRHIWMHSVFTVAQVSMVDVEAYCGRARLNRWYDAGEPVWMAADSLRSFVNDGKRHDRNDREVAFLAGKMKVRNV